jgi:hypothetical protein
MRWMDKYMQVNLSSFVNVHQQKVVALVVWRKPMRVECVWISMKLVEGEFIHNVVGFFKVQIVNGLVAIPVTN